MYKKYIVRLTDEERAICEATIKKETGKSEKLRRATVLLKADADGPAWNDTKISEAVGCRRQTVENVRGKRSCSKALREAAGSGKETGNAADAENAGRRGRGEVDRHAVGVSRLRASAIGRYACWPINWSNWRLLIRSARETVRQT